MDYLEFVSGAAKQDDRVRVSLMRDLNAGTHTNGRHVGWLKERQEAKRPLAQTSTDAAARVTHEARIAELDKLLGATPALTRLCTAAQVRWLREYHCLEGVENEHMFDTVLKSIRLMID